MDDVKPKNYDNTDHKSGQIIAASHDLGPQMVVFSKRNPLISGKSRLVKYFDLAT